MVMALVGPAAMVVAGGVKQEDMQPTLSLVAHRPGTSTGYEGETDLLYQPHHPSAPSRTWYVQDADRSHSRQASSHSFRDPGQSFRAPPHHPPHLHPQPLRPPPPHPHLHQHSNRTPASPFSPQESHSSNSVSPISCPLHGQSQQPTTAPPQTPMSDQGLAAAVHPLHLVNHGLTSSIPPTLAAVVSSSLPPSQWGAVPQQSVFPVPSGPGIVPRPSTATRPGTAPASYYPSHPSFSGGGSGVVPISAANSYGPSEWPAHRQDMAPPPMPLTPQSAVDTTHHLLSTHRRSPTSLSSHGSDHSLESTMMTANGSAPPQAARNLDPNLDPSVRPFLPISALQGIPVTGSTSRPNTASTSLAALAIADAPASYEQPYRQQSPARSGFEQQTAATGGGPYQGIPSPSPSSGSGTSASTSPRGSSVASTSPRVSGRVFHQQYQQHQQRTPVFGSVVPTSAVLRHGGAPLHPHPYGQSQPSAQVGPGSRPRTPLQGPAPGQAQALHVVMARPNLVGNAPSKFDSRSLLPTPPLPLE
jgi:hypothetical protein